MSQIPPLVSHSDVVVDGSWHVPRQHSVESEEVVVPIEHSLPVSQTDPPFSGHVSCFGGFEQQT